MGVLAAARGAKTNNKFPCLLAPNGMVSLFLNGVKVGVCPGVRQERWLKWFCSALRWHLINTFYFLFSVL